jgi:L-glyceraldehyde 3-phosphate reductase
VAQLDQNLAVLESAPLTDGELAEIDRLAVAGGVTIPGGGQG